MAQRGLKHAFVTWNKVPGTEHNFVTWHKVSISNHCATLNEFSLCYLLVVLLLAGLALSFIKMNFLGLFHLHSSVVLDGL